MRPQIIPVMIAAALVAASNIANGAPLDWRSGTLQRGSPESDARVEFSDDGFAFIGSDSGAGTRSFDQYRFTLTAELPPVELDFQQSSIELQTSQQRFSPTRAARRTSRDLARGRPLSEIGYVGALVSTTLVAKIPVKSYSAKIAYDVAYSTEDDFASFDSPICLGCSDQLSRLAAGETIRVESEQISNRRAVTGTRRLIDLSSVPDEIAEWLDRSAAIKVINTREDVAEFLRNPRPDFFKKYRDQIHPLDREPTRRGEVVEYFKPQLERLAKHFVSDNQGSLDTQETLEVAAFAGIDSFDQLGGAGKLTISNIRLELTEYEDFATVRLSSVPVPPAMVGLLSGLAGLAMWRGRRRRVPAAPESKPGEGGTS